MPIENIHLRKLLRLLYAPKPLRTSIIRQMIRDARSSEDKDSEGGGDFYGPFWADAKRYVAGEIDLRHATKDRIESNKLRKNLYPVLQAGFLNWWEDRRRRRNEPFKISDRPIKARHIVPGVGTIKVENTLTFTVGEDGHRVAYPYFCSEPKIDMHAARLGLYVMGACIDQYSIDAMRILDVQRGVSFSTQDTKLQGDEASILEKLYRELIAEYEQLSAEY